MLETYPAFRQFYHNAHDGTGENEAGAKVAPPPAPATVTSEEQAEAAAALQAALRQDLLARILRNPPAFFERVIATLLVAMGYGGSLPTLPRP
ncbi:hypothetical protein V5F31_16120 [Xanthobacter sp. V7C-4]|uniref:hypothetical protein n=1 Tax=Xanthobacter autotrophicus (strain ATCC BAA-1158 / Py2) TaxID=78245 RepID=UPI00372C38DC